MSSGGVRSRETDSATKRSPVNPADAWATVTKNSLEALLTIPVDPIGFVRSTGVAQWLVLDAR
jgi:hypothetical protein